MQTTNKIWIGVLFGLILGFLDGATAWFYPETRPVIGGILVGSSFKGMLVGILSGWFGRKVNSVGWGIAAGAGLGLLFALIVAYLDAQSGTSHYLEITLPGFVVGGMIGFLTQRLGRRPNPEYPSVQ